MAEQDLKIKITVDDHGASSALKTVHSLLKDINLSVGTLNNNGGLPTTNKLLREFAASLRELSSVNGANISALGKQVNHMLVTLGRLDVSRYSGNIDKTTAQLGKMSQTIANFAGDGKNMEKGVEGLERLPRAFQALDTLPKDKLENLSSIMATLAAYTAKAAKNGSGINALATGLTNLPSALRSFGSAESYSDKIEQVKETLQQFGDVSVKGGASFESVANGISKLPVALREFGEASDYTKGIEQVGAALTALEPAVSSIYKYGNGIGSLADGLSKLPGALAGFKTDTDYSGNIAKIGEVLTQLSSVFEQFDKQTTRMVEKGSGKNLRMVEKDITSGFKGLVSALSRLQSMGKVDISAQLEQVAEAVKKFVHSLSSITSEQAEKVYNLGVGLKNLVDASKGLDQANERLSRLGKGKWGDTLRTALKSLGTELKKLPRRVMTAVKWLGKLAYMPFKPIVNGISKITETFKRFFHSVARIALYRLIRSGLKMVTQGAKEGIDNLYKWGQIVGDSFVPTMDHLASEFLYLKNSVGAAISPVIQALEPIITNIIHRFVELLNVFNQFVSMLAGKSEYRRAIYYATTYGEQLEDSLDGAGHSAKELKDILMDFDELNLITTPKDRSSGNDANEDDYGLMFEVVDIDESLFDWLNSADWTAFGTKFADKIAEMLNGINWTNIQSRTKSFGEKIGSFLNGIFTNEEMFKAIGASIGEGLNTSATFVNTLFDGINWTKLGSNIASALKRFLNTARMNEIGRALTQPLKALAEIIIGFTRNMGEKDWKDLADAIYELFENAMKNIPWARLIPALVELSSGLIRAITAAIKGIASAKNEIKKGFRQADIGGLITAAWEMLCALFTDIPVIPIILTFSVAKVAFTAATTALIGKLFASGLAKAMGGSVVGGAAGATAGGQQLALPGPGMISVGMNFLVNATIGFQIGHLVESFKQTGNRKATQSDYDALVEKLREGVKEGALSESSVEYAIMNAELQRNYGNANWADHLNTLAENYDEWLALNGRYYGEAEKQYAEHLAEMKRQRDEEHQLFLSDIQSQLGDALTKIGDFYDAGLIDTESYGRLVKMYFDGNIDGINRALGAAKSNLNFLAQDSQKTLDTMLKDGKITVSEYQRLTSSLYSDSVVVVKDTVAEIERIWKSVNSQKWGEDIANGLAYGINSKAGLVHQAVVGMAKDINRNMAFSEPEEGPLSDFHTYMPDMIDLMVQGIRENQYKVENTVNSLAGTVAGIRDVPINPTKDASGTQDMASGIYEANAEERALLRELINAVKEKRLTISPSANLGKVVNQSTRLYAGVTG